MDAAAIRALTFDVFGTVVDWRSSIIREGEALGRAKGLTVDWPKFADAWRAQYQPNMERVRKGEIPWTRLDNLHRMALDGLLADFGVRGLSEQEVDDFNHAWHRLDPWPDVVPGLTRLKPRFVLVTLSNGNVAMMVNMAKRAGLPWDVILGAEIARRYKPEPEVYLTAADLLGLRPDQCLMVAAHSGDLAAASHLGFHTAFISRPNEHGPGHGAATAPEGQWDIVADGFTELAAQLGC